MVRLSPIEIYDKEFRRGFFVKSYDPNEVDDFLDEVATEYEKLFLENERLSSQLEELETENKRFREMEKKIKNTMKAAQETAREKETTADNRASLIIEKAEMKSREILSKTRHEITKKYSQLEKLQEMGELFRIRFRSLLEAHLELLEREEQLEKEIGTKKEDLAPESMETGYDDLISWMEEDNLEEKDDS